ncbi:transposase [Tessaracoccus sp. MC1756]|uniref:transposase n=1 Tax=Tessaracoccus sp. MC1756 TaxID=2760311 RepID=UPI00351C45D3
MTVDGNRDILGLWVGDRGEGAKYGQQVLNEIKNRAVTDVLMLVCDGLKGLPDSVGNAWPKTTVQTYVVHLIRGSFRHAARQDWDKIARSLRPIYTADTVSAAETRFSGVHRRMGHPLSGDREAVVRRVGRVRSVPAVRQGVSTALEK